MLAMGCVMDNSDRAKYKPRPDVRPLCPVHHSPMSVDPFSNFGTLQGDTVDSSDPNAHLCGDPLPAGRINNKSLWRPDSIS